MESQNNNFITLAEASKLTGYHQDYLGFLCRTQKLKGFKLGRNWVVTKTDLDQFIQNYKNGVEEIIDETGGKIPVHVEKETEVSAEAVKGVGEVSTVRPLLYPPLARGGGGAGIQFGQGQMMGEKGVMGLMGEKAAQGSQEIEAEKTAELSLLKKEVLESVENRVKTLGENLQRLEEKTASSAPIYGPKLTADESARYMAGQEAGSRSQVLGDEEFFTRPNLTDKFAASLALEEETKPSPYLTPSSSPLVHLRQGFGGSSTRGRILNGQEGNVSRAAEKLNEFFDKKNLRALKDTFLYGQKFLQNRTLAYAASIAILGFVASVGWNYLGQNNFGSGGLTQVIYQKPGGIPAGNLPPAAQPPAENKIVINQQPLYQTIVKNSEANVSLLNTLIDQRLNDYIKQGKFIGPKGDTGPMGPAGSSAVGLISYVQPSAYNSSAQGTFAGVTHFSSSDLSGDNATIGSLVSTGSATFNGTAYLNGTTTAAFLTVTKLNPGFTQGSVAFQGSGQLTQDNNNFFYDAANKELGIGTSTPAATLTIIASGSSTPLTIASATGLTLLTVLSTGNVGINTSTPAAKLSLQGTAGADDLLNIASSTGASIFKIASNGNVGINSSSPAALLVAQGSSGSLADLLNIASSSSASQLIVKASGNIGINTSTPLAMFAVQGSGATPPLIIASSTGVSLLTVIHSGNVGINSSTPAANLTINQISNGDTVIYAQRKTDNVPSGDFIIYKTANASTTLFRVDNSGNLLAGGIINSGSQTITSVSTPQFRVQYDPSNEWTASTNSSGVTTFGFSGVTPAASWGPQSNSVNTFSFNDVSSNSVLSIDTTNRRVGIGTTSPTATLFIQGTSTAPILSIISSTSVQSLFVANNGNVGIGTSPSYKFHVAPGGYSVFENTVYVGDGVGDSIITGAWSKGLTLGQFNGGAPNGVGIRITYPGSRVVVGTTGNNPDPYPSAIATVRAVKDSTLYPIYNSGIDLFAVEDVSGSVVTAHYFVIKDGGNVGIGTTSPTASLFIQGTSTTPMLSIISSTSVQSLFVANNGNVGIGMTAPGASWPNAQLEVLNDGSTPGGILARGGNWAGLGVFSQSAGGSGYTQQINMCDTGDGCGFQVFSSRTAGIGNAAIYVGGNGTLWMSNNRLSINANVSTSSSSPIFSVYGNVYNSNILASVPTARFTQTSGMTGNIIEAISSSITRFVINADGNVGIGSTSPTALLALQGTSGSTTDLFNIASSTNVSQFIVKSSGNVGIGITNPSYTLDVSSSVSDQVFRVTSGNANGGYTVYRDGSNSLNRGIIGYGSAFSTGAVISDFGIESLGKLIFLSNGDNVRAVIDTSGNVGIGTTNPSSYAATPGKLEVSGSTGDVDGGIIIRGGATDRWANLYLITDDGANTPDYWRLSATTNASNNNDFRIGNYSGSAWTDFVTVLQSNGNVGIGNTSPSYLLDVMPASGVSSDLFRVASSTGSVGMVITNQGNVGIGTTSPATKLQVYGGGTYSASFMNGNVGIGTTAPYQKLHISEDRSETTLDISTRGQLKISNPNNGVNTNALIQFSGPNNDISALIGSKLIDPAGGDSAIVMGVRDNTGTLSEKVRIQSNGNVGIGTTSPNQLLSVGSIATPGNAKIADGWLCVDNNDTCIGATVAGTVYAVGAYTTGADVAENYPTLDTDLEAGDVVMADTSFPVHVKKASFAPDGHLPEDAHQEAVLGVVSTKPGVLLNGYKSSSTTSPYTSSPSTSPYTLDPTPSKEVPVALAGRVPVKVTNENGNIKIGDYLTASKQFNGYAMKAMEAGPVLGRALESFNGDPTAPVGTTGPTAGKILMFMQITYFQPKVADLVQSGANSDDQIWLNGLVSLNMTQASVLGDIAVKGSLAVQKDLRVGGIIYAAEMHVDTVYAKKLCLDDVCITKDELQKLLDMSNQQAAAATSPAAAPSGGGTLPSTGEGNNSSSPLSGGGEVGGTPNQTPSNGDGTGQASSTPLEAAPLTGQAPVSAATSTSTPVTSAPSSTDTSASTATSTPTTSIDSGSPTSEAPPEVSASSATVEPAP